MNNIIQLFKETNNAEEFAAGYFKYLYDLLKQIDLGAVAAFIEELKTARRNGNTVFFSGNGGSAATAMHMANDIGLDIMKKSGADRSFRALALSDNVPIITAIGNDDGYNNIFLYQLKIHYRPGDKLVVISASGNSENVVVAAKWVKQQGGTVIGLVGFDGGSLKDICDIVIHVKTPKGEYGPVEDIHMIMDHIVANYLLGLETADQENMR
jgi:D-sedoheptulose 7-phosphate isomerase|tara:strand:- start:2260 stop:2892 length:633 start_codon:yes stop_codon:yes gene_type:complete